MKTITLKVVIPDGDVEGIVEAARKLLPTWNVRIGDEVSPRGIAVRVVEYLQECGMLPDNVGDVREEVVDGIAKVVKGML